MYGLKPVPFTTMKLMQKQKVFHQPKMPEVLCSLRVSVLHEFGPHPVIGGDCWLS